jgi:hypothetical protein
MGFVNILIGKIEIFHVVVVIGMQEWLHTSREEKMNL